MQGQGLATLDCDSWIKKGGGCACICVRVCRLREWNRNEKCVRWLGNKEPSVVVLEFVVFGFFNHPIENSRFVDIVYTYFIQGQVVMFTFSYPSQN